MTLPQTHHAAAADHGPSWGYLRATQPRWVTAFAVTAAGALILGSLSAIAMCAHLIVMEPHDPHPLLAAGFALGIVGGLLLLLPMLVYRSAKGLPFVLEQQFVRPSSVRMIPLWGAYIVVFLIAVPLLARDYGGSYAPRWLDAIAPYAVTIVDWLRRLL
jgi:hypothetical protein